MRAAIRTREAKVALSIPFAGLTTNAHRRAKEWIDTGLIGQRRYWRGPTWLNAAWLVWLGLTRLGYAEQADRSLGTGGFGDIAINPVKNFQLFQADLNFKF